MEVSHFLNSSFWKSSNPFFCEKISPVPSSISQNLKGCMIFGTSGSSGERKWVVLQKKAILTSSEVVNDFLELHPKDIFLLAIPLFHIGGFSVLSRAYLLGARISSFSRKWNAIQFCEEIKKKRVTVTSLVPTQIWDLVASSLRSPPSLRIVIIGGGAISLSLWKKARELGWRILPSYGLTEGASQVATTSLDSFNREKLSFSLPLLPHWEAKIQEEREEGRLLLKGNSLLSFYLIEKKEGFSLEHPLREGWFQTQDMVSLQGRDLKFLGRSDRRVKIFGKLINLDFLENQISNYLIFSDFFLISLQKEREGERLLLCCEEKNLVLAEKGLKSYHKQCESLERISGIRVVKMRRNSLGKILKKVA